MSELKKLFLVVLENQLEIFLACDTQKFLESIEFQQNRFLLNTFLPLEISKSVYLQKKFLEHFSNIWEKLAAVAAEQGKAHPTTHHSRQHQVRQVTANPRSPKQTRASRSGN